MVNQIQSRRYKFIRGSMEISIKNHKYNAYEHIFSEFETLFKKFREFLYEINVIQN